MTKNLYSIYDRLAEEFSPVFEAKNDAIANRMFNALSKDADLTDQTLYRVGSFTNTYPPKLENDFELIPQNTNEE